MLFVWVEQFLPPPEAGLLHLSPAGVSELSLGPNCTCLFLLKHQDLLLHQNPYFLCDVVHLAVVLCDNSEVSPLLIHADQLSD